MFERPLSDEDAKRIITAGQSINEGHLLRLYAILDVAGLLKTKLNKDDPVERRILLVINLRNKIAHGCRECMPSNKFHQKLVQEILDLLYNDDMVDKKPSLGDGRRLIERRLQSGAAFPWPLSILGALKPLTSTARDFICSFIEGNQSRA